MQVSKLNCKDWSTSFHFFICNMFYPLPNLVYVYCCFTWVSSTINISIWFPISLLIPVSTYLFLPFPYFFCIDLIDNKSCWRTLCWPHTSHVSYMLYFCSNHNLININSSFCCFLYFCIYYFFVFITFHKIRITFVKQKNLQEFQW